jgi:hypothetical protein
VKRNEREVSDRSGGWTDGRAGGMSTRGSIESFFSSTRRRRRDLTTTNRSTARSARVRTRDGRAWRSSPLYHGSIVYRSSLFSITLTIGKCPRFRKHCSLVRMGSTLLSPVVLSTTVLRRTRVRASSSTSSHSASVMMLCRWNALGCHDMGSTHVPRAWSFRASAPAGESPYASGRVETTPPTPPPAASASGPDRGTSPCHPGSRSSSSAVRLRLFRS